MHIENTNFQKRLLNLFIVFALAFGIIIILLLPPYSGLDESAHLTHVFRISHGDIFPTVVDGNIASWITSEELDFYVNYSHSWLFGDYGADVVTELSTRPASDEMVRFGFASDSYYNPLSYILPGLFIFLLRVLGFSINAFNTMMLAKIVNLIFYVIVTYWALRKTAILQKTMFILALMPMSMLQASSVSYDALILPCSFLLFSYVTKILFSDASTIIGKEDIFAICFAATFIIGCKVAYAPILLILFAIPIKKFGNLKKYLLCIGVVIAVFAISYVVPRSIYGAIVANAQEIGSGSAMSWNDMISQQKEYLFSAPFNFLKVIFSTVKEFGGKWAKQFFCVFEYKDIFLPPIFIAMFYIVFLYVSLTEILDVRGVRWNARLLSFGGIAIFLLGTIYVMYTQWNPYVFGAHGGDIAYGGQGRYFIPIALFAFLIICCPFMSKVKFLKNSISQKMKIVAEYVTPIVSFVCLSFTVLLAVMIYWF